MILLKNENSIYKALITLQRKVITCLYKKIEVFDLKRELVNPALRYQKFICKV